MNTNFQIALLVAAFLVCGVCGYFLGDVVIPDTEPIVEDVPIVEEPVVVLSTIPIIESVTDFTGKGGKYSFWVTASVESGDDLIYGLYRDELCLDNVAASLDGQFVDIPGTETRTYYVQVENINTNECSEIIAIDGFAKIAKVAKVTKEDLEYLFNVTKSWSAASAKILAGVPTSVQIQVLNQEIEKKRSVNDICMQIESGVWASVTVHEESLVYDAHDKLIRMTISVNR